MIIPAGFNNHRLELGLVLRYRATLNHSLESPLGFHLFVAVAKCRLQFIEECSRSSYYDLSRVLQVVELGVLQIIFQVWQDPFVRGSSQVRSKKQEFLPVSVELLRVQSKVRQALELERLDLVTLSGKLGRSVHLERCSSRIPTSSRSVYRHVVEMDVL